MTEPAVCEALAALSVALLVGLRAWPRASSPALEWMRRRGLIQVGASSMPRSFEAALGRIRGWMEDARQRAGLAPGLGSTAAELSGAAALGGLGGAVAGWLTGQMASALFFAAAGVGAGPAGVVLRLRWLAAARRRRLALELAPTLELLSLELASGAAPLTALGAVAGRSSGALATELRRILIAAQIPGGGPFEARLTELADRQRLPPLASLAAALGASREYGASCGEAVRVLAQGVRRAQREELIARGRRSLNRVLIPAALGVLLPFLGLLLFPALAGLARAI